MIGRSWIRPVAVALGAALALGVVFAADARGAPADGGSGGGGLGPGWVVATASDLGAGTFPGAGLPAVAPPAASPYSWSRAVTGAVCVVLAGPVPPALAGELSPLPGMVLFPGVPVHMGAVLGAPSGAVRWEHAATVPAGAHVVGPLVFDVATPTDPARDIEVLPRCLGAGEPLPPGVRTAAEVW